MSSTFTGLIAAPHTPFHPDMSMNSALIEKQAEQLIQQNVRGAFVAGTTGECHSLSIEERLELAKRWVDVASGNDFRILVHVGHNSLPEAQALAQQAGKIGADGIAVVAPSYYKAAGVEDLIDFCAAIAKKAPDLPFYYYDIPGMTGVHLSSFEFLSRGREKIPNLRGLKYSNLDMVQLQECLGVGEFEVYFGCDEALLTGLALGVQGAVGATYNYAAGQYHRILNAFTTGDLEVARGVQLKTVQMVRVLQGYGFLAASKHLMKMLGVDCGPVRLPLRNLTEEQQRELTQKIESLELLSDPLSVSHV